jgi:hypothetical protein
MNKIGKEWITRKMADVINNLFTNSKPAHIPMKWKEIEPEDPVKYNTETVKETTTPDINSSKLTVTGLILKETGNKPKQSTGMRKKCGIQGKENEVDERNTSLRNRGITSTQNNDDRNSEERPNQTEDEASSDNNNVKSGEDGVPLQTSFTTPIDIVAYPISESLDGKENEEPTKLALPSYPRRNCPTKKNPDFL